MKSAKFLPIFGSKPLDTCILVHLLLSCYKIIHSTTEYQVLNKSRDIKYSLISSTKNSCIDSFDFSLEKVILLRFISEFDHRKFSWMCTHSLAHIDFYRTWAKSLYDSSKHSGGPVTRLF